MLTLIIGAVVGLVVVAFIFLTENLGSRLYPAGGAAWRRVLVPMVGALSTGFLLYRYFPNARGSGIPQTKTALFLNDGLISLRTVLGKFALCSVSLASGIALGREGPSVQVGAGIASVLGRKLGLSAASVKALVPAGASAALAAAFNTPISAVLFSLEEVMGDLHAPILGSIVLSSATSWIVLHLLLGDEPLFHVPAYQLVHPLEFVFYAALGLIGGIVSVGFVKLLLWQRKHFLHTPALVQWFLPGLGGLTVGLLGWFYPQVLGVGYGFVGQALNGQLAAGVMAVLVILKLVATATCYASGNAGGIFGPSLFLGAMLGGAVGGVAHTLAPDYTGSAGAYALVGMGAAFAGIVRVPMTSVIMIFEITRDYSIIVPLMIANLISYFLSSKLQDEPIYEALQHQDGIHLPSGARAREALLTVGRAFRTDSQVLAAAQPVEQALASVNREQGAWPVIDSQGLRGVIALRQMDEAVGSGQGHQTLEQLVPVPGPLERLTADGFPHLHLDHPLEYAIERIAESGLPVLPVVSRRNIRELKGTISVSDILSAYHAAREKESATGVEEARSPVRLRLLGGLLTALASLVILTGFLNYFYRAERRGQAQLDYKSGNELLAKERYDEAVEQYRKALSISHSAEYRLALALALIQSGKPDEASSYLNEVLKEQPQSGPANLGMSRILAQRGRIDEAVVHFQQAATGSWPSNPQGNRIQAGLDLADALAAAGRQTQARAELLSLAAQVPNDSDLQKQIAHRLADLGLLKEAADQYRDVIEHHPQDAAAYDELGRALFGLADYAAAREAFRNALKIDPSNPTASQRSETCARVLKLDPTLRGLAKAERFRRSREILAAALDALSHCDGGAAALPPSAKSDIQSAQTILASKKRPVALSDATDANLDLAGRLWSARLNACPVHPAADDALRLLMAKLANQ